MTTARYGGGLSALRTGRLYPQEYSWYSFSLRAESTPHSLAGLFQNGLLSESVFGDCVINISIWFPDNIGTEVAQSVSIVPRLWSERSGFDIFVCGGGGGFSCGQSKWWEVAHSPPSSAKVRQPVPQITEWYSNLEYYGRAQQILGTGHHSSSIICHGT